MKNKIKSIAKKIRSKVKLPKINLRGKKSQDGEVKVIRKFRILKVLKKAIAIIFIISFLAFLGFTTFSKFGELLYPAKYQFISLFIPKEIDKDFRLLDDQILSLNEKMEQSSCVQAKYIEQNLIQTQISIISKLPYTVLSIADNPETPENEASEKKVYGDEGYFKKLIESISRIKFDNTNCFSLDQIASFVDVYFVMDIYLNNKSDLISSNITSLESKFNEHKKILDEDTIKDQGQIDILLELLAIAKKEFANIKTVETVETQDLASLQTARPDFEKYFNSFLILQQANEDFELNSVVGSKYSNLSESRTRNICLLFSLTQEECKKEFLDGYWNSINEIESPAEKAVKSVESLKGLEVFR